MFRLISVWYGDIHDQWLQGVKAIKITSLKFHTESNLRKRTFYFQLYFNPESLYKQP